MAYLAAVVAGVFCVFLFQVIQAQVGIKGQFLLPTYLLYPALFHIDAPESAALVPPTLLAFAATGLLHGILLLAVSVLRAPTSFAEAARGGFVVGVIVTTWSFFQAPPAGTLAVVEILSGLTAACLIAFVSCGALMVGRVLLRGPQRLPGH